jgi:hypothetical protein
MSFDLSYSENANYWMSVDAKADSVIDNKLGGSIYAYDRMYS